MIIDVVTKADLQIFADQLLQDITALLQQQIPASQKKWLKGIEVRNMLGISPGKLQTLRVTKQLTSTKIGGVHYYRYADIDQLMKGVRHGHR
jgi:hypothetical protein